MSLFEIGDSCAPLWEAAGAQTAVVRLAEAGDIVDPVLDVGCGTAENTLFLAARGHEVWGIDPSPAAVARARDKAFECRLPATFVVANPLHPVRLGRAFATAIDAGFFHTLSDAERPLYARGLRRALVPGGRLHLLCLSEFEPGEDGPRRVTREEIRATFSAGWRVRSIRPSQFETQGRRAFAWLADIERDGEEAEE